MLHVLSTKTIKDGYLAVSRSFAEFYRYHLITSKIRIPFWCCTNLVGVIYFGWRPETKQCMCPSKKKKAVHVHRPEESDRAPHNPHGSCAGVQPMQRFDRSDGWIPSPCTQVAGGRPEVWWRELDSWPIRLTTDHQLAPRPARHAGSCSGRQPTLTLAPSPALFANKRGKLSIF
jgi:hypothetical protein